VAGYEGQTVLVTGASRGLGLAVAERYAQLGARVGLVARDSAALQAAAAKLAGQTHVVSADLTDPAECARAADEVAAALGPVDVLASCAGTLQRAWVEDVTPADLELNWRLHVGAPLWLTQRVLPGMRARRRGSLVFVSSELGLIAAPSYASYCVSKSGLVSLAETLYHELGGSGVRVSVACPGDVQTDQLRDDIVWGPTGGGVAFEKAMSTERVAAAIVRAAERRNGVVVVDRLPMRLLFAIMGGPRGATRRGSHVTFKPVLRSRATD
jgi:short-subunit dehydrogenase